MLARDIKMGDKNCGYRAGSHQDKTMNCPKNGPGSGFKTDQKFAAKDAALSTIARDALTSFGGESSLERRFSGGDDFGGVFERNGDWYCTWNGTEHGPFPSRAAAMEKKMMRGDSLSAIARDALSRDERPGCEYKQDHGEDSADSLSELIDRVRGGIREQVGDKEY